MLFGKNAVDWQQRIDFDRLRRDRLARANQMMHQHGIGSAILFSWDSRRYVSSVWNHPYARHLPYDYVLLIRDAGFPYVRAKKGLDERRLMEDCPWLENRLILDDRSAQSLVTRMTPEPEVSAIWAKHGREVKSLLQEHGVADLPLGVDFTGPNMINALQAAGLNVVDGNAFIQEARMIKTDDEVRLMQMAACCNEAGYAALIHELRPGMRENDAQSIMAKAIYASGAEYIEGWVVNSGPRTAPRSFNWSDRVIRPGELLSMEACHVTYCGYKVCYDRTFLVGNKPTELQKETYDVAVEMHRRVQQLLKPGITTHDVARSKPAPTPVPKSVEDIRNFRSGWTNHFGGIGIGWYEAPYLMLEEPPVVLEKNMVVTYHAIFWVEGAEGVAIENTYRITDTGCENLCKWPYEELMVIGM